MAITTTTNKSLIEVTVGTESGTWGPYLNANQGLLDNMLGGTATIALTNTPVILSSAQYQCAFLRFTGAITANIAVTLPPVGSFYTVINDTTNSSNFILTMATTAAGGRVIGVPPGSMTDIMTDGTNARFRGFPHVGAYWDHAGSSVPAWVSACTVAPYLYCNGSVFSSAVYPALANYLNGNTLPDLRGRVRSNLNDGTGRITLANSGLDGNTILSGGGDERLSGHQHLVSGDTGGQSATHTHAITPAAWTSGGGQVSGNAFSFGNTVSNTGNASNDHTHNINFNSGFSGGGNSANVQPTCIGGITMVRAG